MTQSNPHTPFHIYADEIIYFVTAAMLNQTPHLALASYKHYFQGELLETATDYNLDLKAWVILNNHYHILFYLTDGEMLANFIRTLHTNSAISLNQRDNQPGRQVWWNYWDWCIRDETDYWRHFNYIHHNPIKHGYVKQLRDWPYSSVFGYLENKGRDWLDDCWRSYPIRGFQIEQDDF
jgi:putative transposase